MVKKNWGFATLAVHGSGGVCPHTGAVSMPIYQSSTFAFKSAEHGAHLFSGEEKGYIYSRISNPTIDALQNEMAFLEKGEGALAFASGMAASTATVLGFCESGDSVLCSRVVYGGTYALFAHILPKLGIEPIFVDGTDLENIENAIKPNTKLLFVETPANPTLDIVDIEACAALAKRHNIALGVDNTFATPYYQQPLSMGADLVIHSATKYIGGHGDTVAGLIISNNEIIKRIHDGVMVDMGGCISPFNAWLLLRGLKTLPIRMDRHSSSAMQIAKFLSFHPKVERVYYPGLPIHPQYALAKKQMKNFGGMISFDLKADQEQIRRFQDALELCTIAVSLGDCDTLVCHPASTTHSTYTPEERKDAHIHEKLVRISVGVEDPQDIIDDLQQGLKKM
ncbi:aminotransferase class I/II-fold pyridoxal phosphate-dependent enzyme [bacterium]|nr:aminotransferase class I/II-fold pyridoxal phosphate-dependent enzyme [bacterium]